MFSSPFQNTLKEIQTISDFLGLSLDAPTLQSISDKCQFGEMKARYTPAMLGKGVYRNDVNVAFMRKGESRITQS